MTYPMHSVRSSNVKAIGYEEGSRTLTVEFLDNSIYEYSGVSLSLYLQLDNADSKGGFLSAEIKGVYPYKKIR